MGILENTADVDGRSKNVLRLTNRPKGNLARVGDQKRATVEQAIQKADMESLPRKLDQLSDEILKDSLSDKAG